MKIEGVVEKWKLAELEELVKVHQGQGWFRAVGQPQGLPVHFMKIEGVVEKWKLAELEELVKVHQVV